MTKHLFTRWIRLSYLIAGLALLVSLLSVVAQTAAAGFQPADTTPPVISGAPGSQFVEATGPDGAIATWTTPTALDDSDGPVPVTCAPTSGSLLPLGRTIVTCSATDAAGNMASIRFNVDVLDTTQPTITPPAPVVAEATGRTGAIATFTATAYDVVDGPLVPICTPASGSTFPLGLTGVLCVATDSRGYNSAAQSYVLVYDTTAPAIARIPADITVQAADSSGAVVSYIPPTATDLVDGPVTPSCAPASGALFPVGVTTVTCTVTDAAGNTASASFAVTVEVPPAPMTRSGFYAPVSMDGSKVNTVKGGATVPLKFEVFAGDAEVTDTAVVASFAVYAVGCESGDLEDPVEFTTTGGTSLHYDAASGQFVQHWRTPRTAGCYQVILTFADGAAEPIVADFRVK